MRYTQLQFCSNDVYLLGFVVVAAVVNDGSFVVDALVGLIEVDAIENECSIDVTESWANDDVQHFACEFVVAFHKYPWDHYRVPYLNQK